MDAGTTPTPPFSARAHVLASQAFFTLPRCLDFAALFGWDNPQHVGHVLDSVMFQLPGVLRGHRKMAGHVGDSVREVEGKVQGLLEGGSMQEDAWVAVAGTADGKGDKVNDWSMVAV